MRTRRPINGRAGRDLRRALHFRVDDANFDGVEAVVAATGLTRNRVFNQALDQWLAQPHIQQILADRKEHADA